MTNDDKKKLYAALSAPFGPEAIERTDGNVTGRGYSTTGLKYQFIVNRLHAVLGIGGFRTTQSITVRAASTSKGRPVYEATCEMTLQLGEWVDGAFVAFAEAHGTGGHTSVSEADARKGAFTNGFKKTIALCCGCGRQAYEGTIDDDNQPSDVDGHRQAQGAECRDPPRSDEGQAQRNRLTAKQLGALWALARKLNVERSAFRNRVRERYGVTPEFLTRDAASALISELSGKLGNGHAHDAGEQPEVA